MNSALPLDKSKVKQIAVIGDNATRKHALGGFGAGVKTKYEVTPLEGLKKRLGSSVSIMVAQGYKAKYLPKEKDARGYSRDPDNEPDKALIDEAVKVAKSADVAILFVGTNREVESEAADRKNMKLPFGQEQLIRAVTMANPNTILVVIASAPLDLSGVEVVIPAIVWSWFNGSEGGNALADVLLGQVNPSGKLPFTIPKKLEDSPAHAMHAFPGNDMVQYQEGIFVGYRWFDTKNVTPLFCFGHGLSYTSFAYSSAQADKKAYNKGETIEVQVKIKNTGKRTGKETVQLYVSDVTSSVPKALKELKAFSKIEVAAGKEESVRLQVKVNDLAYFDEPTRSWVVEPGEYKLLVGSSSRDIKKEVSITVN